MLTHVTMLCSVSLCHKSGRSVTLCCHDTGCAHTELSQHSQPSPGSTRPCTVHCVQCTVYCVQCTALHVLWLYYTPRIQPYNLLIKALSRRMIGVTSGAHLACSGSIFLPQFCIDITPSSPLAPDWAGRAGEGSSCCVICESCYLPPHQPSTPTVSQTPFRPPNQVWLS